MKKDENKKLNLEEEKSMIKRLREYQGILINDNSEILKKGINKNVVKINYPIIQRSLFIPDLLTRYEERIDIVCTDINSALEKAVQEDRLIVVYEMDAENINDFVYCEVCRLLKSAGYVFEAHATMTGNVSIIIRIGLNQEIFPYEKINIY